MIATQKVMDGIEIVRWPEWEAFARRLGVVQHPHDLSIKITFGADELAMVEHVYHPVEGTGRLLDLEDNHA